MTLLIFVGVVGACTWVAARHVLLVREGQRRHWTQELVAMDQLAEEAQTVMPLHRPASGTTAYALQQAIKEESFFAAVEQASEPDKIIELLGWDVDSSGSEWDSVEW